MTQALENISVVEVPALVEPERFPTTADREIGEYNQQSKRWADKQVLVADNQHEIAMAGHANATATRDLALVATGAASDSAESAKQAGDEANRSRDQADRSEAAKQAALVAAAAAGAEAGFPSMAGKAGRALVVNASENGAEWKAVGFEVGGVYVGAKKPTLGTWLDTDAVYLQASYPELFAALGLVASLPVWTSRFTHGGTSWAFANNGSRAVLSCSTSPYVWHTTDGISWTSITGPGAASIASSSVNGSFVGVGVNLRSYSPDGVSWANQSTGSVTYKALSFGNERYITFSQLGASIYSPTGESWTNGPAITALGAVVSMVFADTQHVAVGANICFTTVNGEAFVSRTIPAGAYTKVAHGNGITLALGASACAISYDSGSSWRPGIAPVATAVSALIFFAGVFYAATTGGLFMTTDGLFWIRLPLADGAAVGVLGAFKGLLLWGGTSVYTAPLYGYNTATQFLTPTWQRGPGVNSWIKAGD